MLGSTKGQKTKNHILTEGLNLACTYGLANISIGKLATKAKMSRSGLFAHFLSKEQLQLEILSYAESLFQQTILSPCQQLNHPLEKIIFLRDKLPCWYEQHTTGNVGHCVFSMANLEFGHSPGKVQNHIKGHFDQFSDYLKPIHRAAIENKVISSDISEKDFSFVISAQCSGFAQFRYLVGEEEARKRMVSNFNRTLGLPRPTDS